ncbi:MAG: CRTAC1 family protein [Saprospiraceae bacterium]|nr:CRTAC1 family protein [Saprospiraceae bacterium]MCF8251363.1 CRTAC1 family protein [Saprospiraceae bacterium]MCF8280538.1 CRTAC1 family protein [Bacteroidales bacterium]MCF8313244.1 CRTAC1 family protein [Saprospiraceae bacterium]MCF8441691.1 CRTAC1 family protein [Saprospiraceae bacterium]
MKKEVTRLFCILLAAQTFAQAPLFEKITTGPLVTTPADSRSVNFVDIADDDVDDIFISNGPQAGAKNLLYLNDGTGNFSEVSGDDIVSHSQPFDGTTFADFDNDGYLDAYVVTWYGVKNYLYRGGGDAWFIYDGAAAPSNVSTYSETASWGDYDNDGFVDLYVTNSGGNKKNMLFHNEGGTAFSQVTAGAPVNDAHTSRSANWVDYDNDGDLDLFVSNEENEPDDLYRNDGGGIFNKITTGAPGQSNRSSMSSSWGDVDNDGDLDLFVANAAFFAPQLNQLFKNNGDGTFTEVTTGQLVTENSCSYGSNFGDYDNDGDLDLVVSNGYCNGNILNFLYQNDGSGNFTRDLASIPDLATPCSYGAAWGDVNNDGFLDLGIATCKNGSSSPLPPNQFFLNNGDDHNWLKIKLIGTVSNRSAIGARVWVTANIGGQMVTQMREISAQSGYCGQNSLTAHFGLGDAENIDEIRVKFLGGQDTTFSIIATNQLLKITENQLPNDTKSTIKELAVNVFPNPASDTFWVEVENFKLTNELNLRFTDSAGRVIFEKKYKKVGSPLTESFSKKRLGMENSIHFLTVEMDGVSETVIVK